MPAKVEIVQIESLPTNQDDMPEDASYVSFGCVTCPSAVCFSVHGLRSDVPEYSGNAQDTRDLNELKYQVEKHKWVRRNSTSTWEGACANPCPQAETVATVLELMNERFGSNIQIQEDKS